MAVVVVAAAVVGTDVDHHYSDSLGWYCPKWETDLKPLVAVAFEHDVDDRAAVEVSSYWQRH